MTELVQIQPIPPLHQSTIDIMACQVFYVEAIIKKRRQPGSMESARGKEVHKTMALYLSHCARNRVSMDLESFDRLAIGAGPGAARILVGVRDHYQVDFEHLLSTEVMMSLDVNLKPTDTKEFLVPVSGDTQLPAHFRGTPDAIYLYRKVEAAVVDDFKTHPRPFEPDEAFQSREYALFVFQHFPWVKSITFRLIFVRYKNLIREVVYTREHDLPKLVDAVRYARARQLSIHDDYEAGRDLDAVPGNHCQYCPKLTDRSCPIAEFNSAMQLTVQERLKFAIWYSQFAKANKAALKAYVQETGRAVRITDHNGQAYVYGPVDKVSKQYPIFKREGDTIEFDEFGRPVMPIIEALKDHAHTYPDDTAWLPNLLISSSKLDSYLGAKKRVFLDQCVSDLADKVPKAKLDITKPAPSLADEEPEKDEWDWEEDDNDSRGE